MTVCVVLLRGVNVGGAGTRLPMADFAAVLRELGCREVATYIQSGNAVVRWDGAPQDLAPAVEAAVVLPNGTHPAALVLPLAAFDEALAACPFRPAEQKALHLAFLDRETAADLSGFEALRAPDEEIALIGRVLYVHTPSGFGKSKLAGRMDALLRPARVTARNLATVRALAALGRGLA